MAWSRSLLLETTRREHLAATFPPPILTHSPFILTPPPPPPPPLPSPLSSAQVDRALTQASEAYRSNSAYIQSQLEIPLERSKQLHNHGLDAYNTARQQYLKKVEDSVSYIKANGVSESAKKAAENVTIRVKEAQKYPSMLLEKVQEAVEHLMALHPLNKAVETVRPQLDAAWTRYNAVHDNVVASEQYKKTYSMAGSALTKAQETVIYQKAKENLYPLIKPYADPAVMRISESQIYNAALTHLAPKA